jgi:hypothetical protein
VQFRGRDQERTAGVSNLVESERGWAPRRHLPTPYTTGYVGTYLVGIRRYYGSVRYISMYLVAFYLLSAWTAGSLVDENSQTGQCCYGR